MKALTVQQPWAWALAHGYKDVENRTTLWSHRGVLAIHAGARWSERGARSPLVRRAFNGVALMHHDLHKRDFRYGAVIGLVVVEDVHRCADGCCASPWAEVAYREHDGVMRGDVVHMVVSSAYDLDPVPCPGRLGLWDLPGGVEHAVMRQADGYVWAHDTEG